MTLFDDIGWSRFANSVASIGHGSDFQAPRFDVDVVKFMATLKDTSPEIY